jgi:uncharacterized membrane protein YjjP (DUF1212 family)
LAMQLDILRAAQLLILIFGGIVIYYASKGYSKQKSRAMLLLAIGFAFVTFGAVAAGLLYELVSPSDLTTAATVQAIAQAAGFFIIVYSLAGTKD